MYNEKSFFPYKSVLSPIMATAANIVLVYILYSIARLEFLFENWSYFSQAVHDGRITSLLLAGLRFDTPGIFYTNALYILLMLIPLHLKERPGWYRMCKWIFIIINTLALAVNFADSVYFSYTLKRTSWSVFNEFGDESFGKIIGVEFLRHWYLVVLLILLVWATWKLYVSPAMDIRRQSLPRYYLLSILSLALAATIAVTGIRGGLFNHWQNYIIALPLFYLAYRLIKQRKKFPLAKWVGTACGVSGLILIIFAPIGGWRHRDIRPIAISNANAFTEQPVETALVLNTPFTMIRSIGNVPFHHPGYFPTTADAEKIFTPLHHPSDSAAVRRKNIVIFIIESFGKEYIGALNKDILGNDYKGFTPFTDSLLRHSAYWRHSYDNGQKSIDGMPSILAGIPMFVRPFIVTPQAVNNIKGLPGVLSEKGYETAFFHGARTGSMGFDGFAKSIGFKHYYGREDFNLDKRFNADKDFDGYWAIWDEPFMQYFALKMTEMKQPFMTAIFTASNHHPFNIPEQYKGKFPEGTMKIHPTVGYTDNALRQFFATAKTQPWYDNTIFVITNDHTNERSHDEYRSA
ncbi:MAG: LTA synthase family protein, partial [Muribaculaceae bacterium]|nr:LTA synthase family protein [Muribaculaceae bacterium]